MRLVCVKYSEDPICLLGPLRTEVYSGLPERPEIVRLNLTVVINDYFTLEEVKGEGHRYSGLSHTKYEHRSNNTSYDIYMYMVHVIWFAVDARTDGLKDRLDLL